MNQDRSQGLVSPSDIADIAEVSRGAVSNWRRRMDDFPKRVAGTESKPLFSRQDVTAWLESRGHSQKTDAGETGVWAALNLVRGQLSADDAADLVLSLAVARKTGASAAADIPQVPPETLIRLEDAIERVDFSALGSAADFALERLAKAQGKLGAHLGFVGSRTSSLLAKLAAARPDGVIYDPACGIGAALIESVKLGARPVKVIGHDINRRALRIAAQRAELNGVDIDLIETNVLAEDIEPGLRADVILLEPPFGVRLDGSMRLTDARFDFGAPPRSSADTAWLQHAVAHLTETGRAYIISPAGPLFRGGEEGKIRAEFVRRGCVEAVVGLPGKLLPQTSIPLALWVLRRPVKDALTESVLFIDASDSIAPENHVAGWLTEPAAQDGVPHAAVPITDVLAAESVLVPQRWVDRAERNPREISKAYVGGWTAINEAIGQLRNDLPSFERFEGCLKSRVMTVGELVEQGVLELRLGRPKDRYEDAPEELRERIVTAADVRDGTLRQTGIDTKYDNYAELTIEGDVLATAMNAMRACVDTAGGHLPSTGVYRLRVLDDEVLSPSYLSIALTGSWNERFQGGSTIQRASIRDLEVPLVPKSQQQEVELAVHSLKLLREQVESIGAGAVAVRTALLDAVRYNAPLGKSTTPVDSFGQDERDE